MDIDSALNWGTCFLYHCSLWSFLSENLPVSHFSTYGRNVYFHIPIDQLSNFEEDDCSRISRSLVYYYAKGNLRSWILCFLKDISTDATKHPSLCAYPHGSLIFHLFEFSLKFIILSSKWRNSSVDTACCFSPLCLVWKQVVCYNSFQVIEVWSHYKTLGR